MIPYDPLAPQAITMMFLLVFLTFSSLKKIDCVLAFLTVTLQSSIFCAFLRPHHQPGHNFFTSPLLGNLTKRWGHPGSFGGSQGLQLPRELRAASPHGSKVAPHHLPSFSVPYKHGHLSGVTSGLQAAAGQGLGSRACQWPEPACTHPGTPTQANHPFCASQGDSQSGTIELTGVCGPCPATQCWTG